MTLSLFERAESEPEHDRGASQWFTPQWLADRLVRWALPARIRPGFRIVEPSAGSGNFVEAAKWIACEEPANRVDAVELDPRWAEHMRKRFHCGGRREPQAGQGGIRVVERDFLTLPVPTDRSLRYDLAVGNPPYEKQADVAFLAHAMRVAKRVAFVVRWAFLANEGTRLAVTRARWRVRGVASLGRVQFEGDGDTTPLSDFAAIKLSPRKIDEPDDGSMGAPVLEWWSRGGRDEEQREALRKGTRR